MIEKWIAIIAVLSSLVIIEDLVKDSQKKYFGIAVFAITWFLTAFRYEIGWDYDSYKNMFFSVDFNIDDPEIEPGFAIIVVLLRNVGFDYQMLFVVFATITYAFFWKGLSFYRSRIDKNIHYGIAAYLLFLGPIFNFYTISAVRQMTAVAIFFWSTKFIVETKFFKYTLALILASLFHYTAILLIPIYFVVKKKISFWGYLLCLLISYFIYQTDMVNTLLNSILPIDSKYMTYLALGDQTTVGIVFLFYLTLICMAKAFETKDYISLNMFFFAVMITLALVNNPPLCRMRIYPFTFIIIFYQQIINLISEKIKKRILFVFLVPIIILLLHDLNMRDYNNDYDALVFPYASAGNIDYQFNFKLWRN